MNEMISSYIGKMSAGFFFDQLAVILALFAAGLLINAGLRRGRLGLLEVLLSFPVGLSVYSLFSFVILMAGLPYNRISITAVMVIAVCICSVIAFKADKRFYLIEDSVKTTLICLITALCITVISTSGLISVSVSNDSLYYYSMYPRAIEEYGFLRPQFDVFLTDVGPTSAILNTLPFMYGFNESFGLQTFMGINTTLAAAYALYGQAVKRTDKKKAAIAAGLLILILICSQPYIIMLKWMMSNGYFMCFIFLTAYAASYYDRTDDLKAEDVRTDKGPLVIMGILFLQMSMLRMEGIMVAIILLACFVPFKYRNRDLFAAFAAPVFICALIYSIKVFLILKVDAPYTFLTPKKAILQLAVIAAAGLYLLIVRGRGYDLAGRHINVVLPCLLIAVNGLLFIYDHSLYIDNLRAFIGNISNRSGWGLFPMFVIAAYVLVFAVTFGNKNDKPFITYWDICFLSYLLAALAVCFAREGALRENIGDSGNRVLMQVTLIAFMAVSDHLLKIINKE